MFSMKILVTGAKGQVGTDVVLEAESRGHQVFGFTSSDLDITDKGSVDSVLVSIKPNVVINAAAYTAVDKAETEKEKAYAVNEAGVINLAEMCKKLDIPLLHISTDYVFDGEKKTPYIETDTPNPLNVYGASKLAGEVALQSAWSKHIILRVSWVFGEYGNNFVRAMLRLAKESSEISVVDDQFGAPTPAKAIAEFFLDVVDSACFREGDFSWGIYHLQSEPGLTWFGFAQEIFSQAKEVGVLDKEMMISPISSEQFPTLAKRPLNSKLNCDKGMVLQSSSFLEWKVGYLQPVLISLASD